MQTKKILNTIINDDCVKVMNSMEPNSVDLIFADPPYDLDQLELIPEKIFSANLLKEGGQFILEHPETYCFDNHPFFIKERKYGNVHFTFFE